MKFRHFPTSNSPWRGKLFFAGMLMLLLGNIGNVYGHVCLDGQEPAVSVHLENLKGIAGHHDDHEGDEQVHNDYEVAMQSSALVLKAKPLQELDLALPASVFVQNIEYHPVYIFIHSPVPVWQAPSSLLPPLRAPPVFS